MQSTMGSGAGKAVTKQLYIEYDQKEFAVEISECSSQELKELLASIAGQSRCDVLTLTNSRGFLVPINSSLPENTPSSCYRLTAVNKQEKLKAEQLEELQEELCENYCKKNELQALVARVERLEEGAEEKNASNIEMFKCKEELDILLDRQDAMHAKQEERQSSQLDLPHILTPETGQALKRPCFDIWRWEPKEMIFLMEYMYQDLGIIEELKMDKLALRKFLIEIRDNYRDNPFHNFRHCFCVTQMMYGMISICNLAEVFSKLELGVLLTAAACHDLDHPGFSNSYQINARTDLAITYNNISPLENHHCAVTLQILDRPETNIFDNVGTEERDKISNELTDLILSTDMSRHGDIIKSFQEVADGGLDFHNPEHRKKIKTMLIKCCDVSNEVRPKEMSEPWVDCLLQEYFKQSELEKKKGLPVTPFMDKDKVTKPKAQIGFIKFVLIPMFKLMKQVFPALDEHMLQPLQASLDRYKQLKMLDDVTKEIEAQTINPNFQQPLRQTSMESSEAKELA